MKRKRQAAKAILLIGLLLLPPARVRAGGKDMNSTTPGVYKKYWPRIEAAAEGMYGGVDISITPTLGMEDQKPYAEVELKVPYLSASKRRSKKKDKIKFLNKASDLLKKLALAKRKKKILVEKAKVMKQTLMQAGQSGINEYFKIKTKLAEKKTEIVQYRRKLKNMIKEGR